MSASLPATASPWFDTPQRFGRITRWLHWGMALLFAWQFVGMGLRLALGRTPLVSFFVGTHASVGLLLLILVLLRGAWGLANRARRPSHGDSLLGRAARLGHAALYLLMFVVPALALVRLYGSGRAFAWFNTVPLFAASPKDEALIAPAALLHGPLAWLLLALVAGHVGMVLLHRWLWRDGVAERMIGRVR
ncbi:cytochrome b [Hydrogenophaga palleronii]|uniref:cytochrome b n=1 Tax=Hydrogenophaga palleronii TaxID=65655 RepID=UPI000824D0D5|nr:cytochrome b [Hydrogenophaga palleronii]